MPEDHHFGVPWAADGDTRPSRHRTVLAHAPGMNGGALWVQQGTDPHNRHWMMVTDWRAWIADNNAKLVVTDDGPEAE